MENPQYANGFSVAYNDVLGEVVINFGQEYPVLDSAASQADGNAPKATRKDVAGVVLPVNVARQLYQIIGETCMKNDNKPNE